MNEISIKEIEIMIEALGVYKDSFMYKQMSQNVMGMVIGTITGDKETQEKIAELQEKEAIEARRKTDEVKDDIFILVGKLTTLKKERINIITEVIE